MRGRRTAALLLALVAAAMLAIFHVTHRAELLAGYENGGAIMPPVYGPVTEAQTVVPRTSVSVCIANRGFHACSHAMFS